MRVFINGCDLSRNEILEMIKKYKKNKKVQNILKEKVLDGANAMYLAEKYGVKGKYPAYEIIKVVAAFEQWAEKHLEAKR